MYWSHSEAHASKLALMKGKGSTLERAVSHSMVCEQSQVRGGGSSDPFVHVGAAPVYREVLARSYIQWASDDGHGCTTMSRVKFDSAELSSTR